MPAGLQVIACDGTPIAETAGKRLTVTRQGFLAIAATFAVRTDSQTTADGGPVSPSKNDGASDVDTQSILEEVIPVALAPGETIRWLPSWLPSLRLNCEANSLVNCLQAKMSREASRQTTGDSPSVIVTELAAQAAEGGRVTATHSHPSHMTPTSQCPQCEPLLGWQDIQTYVYISVQIERPKEILKEGHVVIGFNVSALVSARIISPSSLAD